MENLYYYYKIDGIGKKRSLKSGNKAIAVLINKYNENEAKNKCLSTFSLGDKITGELCECVINESYLFSKHQLPMMVISIYNMNNKICDVYLSILTKELIKQQRQILIKGKFSIDMIVDDKASTIKEFDYYEKNTQKMREKMMSLIKTKDFKDIINLLIEDKKKKIIEKIGEFYVPDSIPDPSYVI